MPRSWLVVKIANIHLIHSPVGELYEIKIPEKHIKKKNIKSHEHASHILLASMNSVLYQVIHHGDASKH